VGCVPHRLPTLREDLLESVGELARSGRFDTVLIESSGISEPMPVAATFEWRFDDGTSLSDHARLDTMVTVVDATGFLAELNEGDALTDRGLEAAEGDGRTVPDVLVDQVEFADVLVLSKTDLVAPEVVVRVEALLRTLDPTARVLRIDHGQVPLAEVLDTGRFDPVLAAENPGWAAELAGSHTPETEEFGIRSTVFRSDRPFHPQRLAEALDGWEGVLRSKGFCWVASRPDVLAVWSQAGPNLALDPGELFGADSDLPRQELVFIGIDLDVDEVARRLDAALLTPAEVAEGPSAWRSLPDPLPEWDLSDLHGAHDHSHGQHPVVSAGV
jgi:G3E family GTPase